MHILITGGTGFIGTELRSMLLKKGHYLTVITRSPEEYEEEQAKNQQFISWEHPLVETMKKTDAVINLAGSSIFGQRWTDQVKQKIYSSRIDNTKKLSSAIKQCDSPPEVMISASGISYYGDGGEEVLDESHQAGSGFLCRVCVDWEAAAEEVTEAGVRWVSTRFGIVLETGGGALQQMLPPFKFFVGGPVGSGDQYFPWIHMHDLCRGLIYTMENRDIEGPCNFNAPNPVTMREFADSLGEVLNRPSFFRVPEAVLRLALGEAADPIVESVRAVPKKLQQHGFEFKFNDVREALADILH